MKYIRSLNFGLALVGALAMTNPIADAQNQTVTHTEIAQTILPRLDIPRMNATNGRLLFGRKGCVVCHSINDIGGTSAISFDESSATGDMNPFDFFAGMWRSAEEMIGSQIEFGGKVELESQDFADIFAFVHDEDERQLFSEDDIPLQIQQLID